MTYSSTSVMASLFRASSSTSAAVFLSQLLACGAEDAAGLAFFEQKVRPVLVEHCYACHSAEAKKRVGKKVEIAVHR
jgi:uncharacterized membrane protein